MRRMRRRGGIGGGGGGGRGTTQEGREWGRRVFQGGVFGRVDVGSGPPKHKRFELD